MGTKRTGGSGCGGVEHVRIVFEDEKGEELEQSAQGIEQARGRSVCGGGMGMGDGETSERGEGWKSIEKVIVKPKEERWN